MALRPLPKWIGGLLAALLVAGSSAAALASQASASAGPKTLRVACALKGGGKLQYRAAGSTDCSGTLLHFAKDGPVTVCQLDKGNSQLYEAKRVPPAHPHAVKGMLFLVSGPGKCKAPKYPDSHARVLPALGKDLKLCAGKRSGTVRVVSAYSKCNDLEFAVVLKKRKPMVATSSGSTAYTENDPATTVDPGLTISDVAGPSLAGATAAVTTGFQANSDKLDFTDQNGITGSYDDSTGVLTLTGSASVADYQAALRSIAFRSSTDDPTTSKAVDFKVDDGDQQSNAATKSISVTPVNDAPTDVPDADPTIAYTEGDGQKALFGDIVLGDPDSPNLVGASLAFTSNYHAGQDQLDFTNTAHISGNWNPTTAVLSLTGTASIAEYQAAIRSITYENTSNNPTEDTRRIDAVVDDGAASNHLSDGFDREVSVTAKP